MTIDNEMHATKASELPFARRVARRIVEDLFRGQAQWKVQALVDRAVQLHRDGGGSVASAPYVVISRVLADMKADGMVDSPAHGYWRWIGDSSEEGMGADTSEAAPAVPTDEMTDDLEDLRPEKEIGTGAECVYLYFNPNDRELAELKGREVWECKVGRTSSSDAVSRILGQGIRTSLSRSPVVGLVIRTDDSAALEQALHSSLRLLEAEVPDSPGAEWFFTSPSRVEAWYSRFQETLATLRGESAGPV